MKKKTNHAPITKEEVVDGIWDNLEEPTKKCFEEFLKEWEKVV